MHSNLACKETRNHHKILEEGVHPEVVEDAEILEVVDADKAMDVLEVKAASTKDHLAMETLTSVPFARKTITRKRIVGIKKSTNVLTVINLVI